MLTTPTPTPVAPGGYAGILVSFEEGCDGDTVFSLYKWWIENGYTIDITLADGTTFACHLTGMTWSNDYDAEGDVFTVIPWNEGDQREGEAEWECFVNFADVVAIRCH